MDPAETANHFIHLDQHGAPGEAASFARNYEDRASEAEFDLYLRCIDLHFEQVAA